MRRLLRVFLLNCILALRCGAAGDSGDGITRLQSPDLQTRREAVDAIQTLDDPHIPEACLPLLGDEGYSIRRQAARAIGSRFQQVPEGRIEAFVTALRRCAEDGPEDVKLIAERAIGLLTRNPEFPAFSKSPDGKWVLYEQRRLPVIADSGFHNPQLLSIVHPDLEMISSDDRARGGNIEPLNQTTVLLKLMVTNEPVHDLFSPQWHPKGDAVALSPRIQRRFYCPIAIWRASDRTVRTWSTMSFAEFFNKASPHPFPHWGTTTKFVKWRDRKALIRVYDVDSPGPGERFDPRGILISVDIDDWKIALEDDPAAE